MDQSQYSACTTVTAPRDIVQMFNVYQCLIIHVEFLFSYFIYSISIYVFLYCFWDALFIETKPRTPLH